jgi:hypothetical protein
MSPLNIEDIKKIIRQVCKRYGVPEEIALKVAECESGFNPNAKHVNPSGSIDRGLFQWNDRWHPEISDQCAYDPVCSTEKFCEAFNMGNISWWNSTRNCWQKAYELALYKRLIDTLGKLIDYNKGRI